MRKKTREKKIKDKEWIKHLFAIVLITMFAIGVNLEEIIKQILVSSYDGLRFIYPLKYFAEKALSGEIPLWNINATIGQTAIGDPQNSLFYVFTYLAGLMSSVDFYNIFYTIHIAVAGIGAYLYFYNKYKKISLAMCAGFLFMLMPVLGHGIKAHGRIIAIISWFPIGFLFIDKYLEKLKFKWIVIAAFLVTFQFSIGFVQDCLYSLIVYSVYLIVGILRQKKGIFYAAKIIAAWGGICFGLMAVMLFPLYELLANTGRGITDFYFFIGGSIFPLEILNTITPNLFLLSYESTAIYIGAFPLVLALYSFIYYRKDKTVKFFFLITLLAYCFAGIGYVPIIRKILYHIPLINSFRVPARALYIYAFGFLGLAVFALSKIKTADDLKKLMKICAFVFVTVVLLAIASSAFKIPYIHGVKAGEESYSFNIVTRNFQYFEHSIINYGIAAIIILVLYLIRRKYNKKDYLTGLLCLLIVVFSVFDQGKYSINNDIYTSTEAYNTIENLEALDKLKAYNNIDESRTLWGTSDNGYINTGMNFLDGIKALNYYGTFENKDFLMMLGEPYYVNEYAAYLSKYHNDLLSMLAVRYIITDQELESLNSYETIENVVLDIPKLDVKIKDDDAINIFVEPLYVDDDHFTKSFELETVENGMFMVSFDIDYNEIKNLDSLKVTIRNSEGTALYTPDSSFFIEKSKKTYTLFFYPSESEASDGKYRLEIYAADKKDFEFKINNIKVTQIEAIATKEPMYRLIDFTDDKYFIYQNMNANSILYLSGIVSHVDNIEDVYPTVNADLDKISYIEDVENITVADGSISDIMIEDNQVSCKVQSNEGVFLNHAQAYYPGWACYVDGEKTTIYKVNGIIQGTYVPAGYHEILFIYKPLSFKIGLIISLFTLLACGVYLLIEKTKRNIL